LEKPEATQMAGREGEMLGPVLWLVFEVPDEFSKMVHIV
jgi:hypothetical protein